MTSSTAGRPGAESEGFVRLREGDPRRYHPVEVSQHPEGLLLRFGREFGDPAWERTKQAVRDAKARFARGLEGWLIEPERFELDRVDGLTVLVDAAAAAAIDRVRRERADEIASMPPALRGYRPALIELGRDEIVAHPDLSDTEQSFVLDMCAKPVSERTTRQREWLKRLEARHRERLDRDPGWLRRLGEKRLVILEDSEEPPEEVERALSFRPRIRDLDREAIRALGLFRSDDRAEIRRILAGERSPWEDQLQARLDRHLAEHPEARLSLFRAQEKRRGGPLADAGTEALTAAKDADDFELPAGFKRERLATGDLYAYQRRGARWLLTTRRGILAHDVGLGKTVQAIAAAAHLFERGEARKAIVVVPKPRLVGWVREVHRFTELSAVAVTGTREERERLYRLARKAEFVVVGYHALQKEVEQLSRLGADVLIVDEAHRLKGRGTLQSKGFAKLTSAPWIFFLTATPMPNRPEELHALLTHLQPDLLGTLWGDFVPRYARTRTIRRGRRKIPVIQGYKHLDELRERIAPYVFVKTASDADVALDLPPLHQIRVELGLAPEQARLYEKLREDASRTLRAIDPARFGPSERANLLTKILRLEQAVISPRLLDPAYKGASPKLDEALEQIRERLETGRPGTVVFCRFLEALALMREALRKMGVPDGLVASIEGRVSPARIDEVEREFHAGNKRVLLASDAAREGLNLQGCADLLIHLDVPWVPNVVHQRNGRIHRQGQTRPVTILHYRVPGTVEQRKVATLRRKHAWISAVLGPAEGASDDVGAALDLEDFRHIIEGAKGP